MIMNNPAILSLIIAIIISPVVPIVHIALIRLTRKVDQVVILMFSSFLAYGAIWLLAFLFINRAEQGAIPAILGGGFLLAFFCLGYVEFFSMVCRGFSLRIIVDVYLKRALSLSEIIENYGGEGMDWMVKKRLKTIESLGMARMNGNVVEIRKPLGTAVGRLGLLVKSTLKMGEGG
jgi:hypothetical protein